MTILTRKDFEKIFYSKKKSREKEPIQELFRIADGYFKIIEKDLDESKPIVLFAGLGLTGALAYALAQILFEHKYETTVVDIYGLYPPIKREIIKKYYGKSIRYDAFKTLEENPNAVYIDAIWGLEYIKGSEGYLDEIYALYNSHSGFKISLEGYWWYEVAGEQFRSEIHSGKITEASLNWLETFTVEQINKIRQYAENSFSQTTHKKNA